MAILKFGVGEITNVTLDYNEPVYEPPKGSFSEQWRYGCNGKLVSKKEETNTDTGKTYQIFVVDDTTMDDLNKGVAKSLPDAPVSLSSDLFGDEPRAEEPTETAPGSGVAVNEAAILEKVIYVSHQELADMMKDVNKALKALDEKIESVKKIAETGVPF